MASSSSSQPASSDNKTISPEEMKLFHNIDRAIFSRLVLNLRREPIESMHVIALFLWLEHYCRHARNLVYSIQTWPDTLINALADEGVRCLSCVNNDYLDQFPIGHVEDRIIPWIRMLTSNEASFSFFRAHRADMEQGIFQLVRDVCFRVFDDIIGLVHNPMAAAAAAHGAVYDVGPGPLLRPRFPVFVDSGNEASLRAQTIAMNNEMEDLWSRMNNICINNVEETSDNNNREKEKQDEADDRTIFVTFSRGYSVSEDEVRDYFTRRFGDIFEGIEMQEVPEGEQPLWAKLVMFSGSAIPMVLNGKLKTKFSINGKHVWARKYVRKIHKSEYQQ